MYKFSRGQVKNLDAKSRIVFKGTSDTNCKAAFVFLFCRRRSSSSHRGERMFSSWRKGSSGSGSRIRSKSSDTSAFLSSTNNDVEGGELDPGDIADNSQETTGSQKERKRSKKSSFNNRAQKNFSTENLLGVEDRQKPTIR